MGNSLEPLMPPPKGETDIFFKIVKFEGPDRDTHPSSTSSSWSLGVKNVWKLCPLRWGGPTPNGKKIEPSPKAHKVMLNCHKTKPNCLVNEIVVKSLELSTIQTFCPRN